MESESFCVKLEPCEDECISDMPTFEGVFVKAEPLLEDVCVKEESLGESAADVAAELYADHAMKYDLVLSPEQEMELPGVCHAPTDWALGDADACPQTRGRGGRQLARACSVRVEPCDGPKSHFVPKTKNTPMLAKPASPLQKHRPYQCKICKKQFRDLRMVHRHILTHTGEKPFECELCQKKFSRLDKLNVHKRIHTGEKPYQCELCDKQFRDLSTVKRHKLIQHKLMHTGERPYECELCQKKFARIDRLNVHKRIHTGEKPYQCEVCNKQFRDLSSIKRHKLIHTGEKP